MIHSLPTNALISHPMDDLIHGFVNGNLNNLYPKEIDWALIHWLIPNRRRLRWDGRLLNDIVDTIRVIVSLVDLDE